jgi:hypothetical protein
VRRLLNRQKQLKAEYQILSELASADSPMGFNELQEKASVSSRTLAEHLKNSIPPIVRKVGGKYRITDAGRQRVENIEWDLEMWTREGRGRRSAVEMVEVYSISPKRFCKGTLKVTSSRKLLGEERGNLDKALTHTIRTFSSIVPEGSRNWRISIYSHTSPKP